MASLNYLTDVTNKQIYPLGTISNARCVLSKALDSTIGNTICLWSEDYASWCEDKYSHTCDNSDYNPDCDYSDEYYCLDDVCLEVDEEYEEIDREDFYKLMYSLSGKEFSNDTGSLMIKVKLAEIQNSEEDDD